MPHIALPDGVPGIGGAFAFRPETAAPMRELAEVLLRGPNSLSSGEREMIASFVSAPRNECHCRDSHRAAHAHHPVDSNYDLASMLSATTMVGADLQQAGALSPSPQNVRAGRQAGNERDDVARARTEGATIVEIPADTVLIAAAF